MAGERDMRVYVSRSGDIEEGSVMRARNVNQQ